MSSSQSVLKMNLVTDCNKYSRLDIMPFLILYPLTTYYACYVIEEEIYSRLAILLLLLLHLLTYLTSHWSLPFKIINQYSHVNTIQQAQYVTIKKTKTNQKTLYEIVPIEKEGEMYKIYLHNKKYIYDLEKKRFNRLKPLMDLPITHYMNKKDNYQQNSYLFDPNELQIPIRSFNDLLKDQLIEPFSFFQFFSVSLWLMDENRFYSLLTLAMLFMTSCTVVLQRIRTMMTMRQMKLNPSYVQLLVDSRWIKVDSSLLKPGDTILVESSHQVKQVNNSQTEKDEAFFKKIIPFSHKLPEMFFKSESMNTCSFKKVQCDLLLLEGSCIVDESILTGESVPQIKDNLSPSSGSGSGSDENNQSLNIKGKHKNNILFCGTEVVQTFNDKDTESRCIARVLRTGFDTSKGSLIRTVLYNNENINIKQYDAYILILILLILAVISSGYVLYQGLQQVDRDRNKLFLRCILIVTTVVPPELPMILSIAVNGSLMYLQSKKIFCTEPFRIPLAGQVSLLAFDKTGTLTVDQLKFKGIVQKDQLDKNDYQLTAIRSLDLGVQQVLAGCHSLLIQNRQVIGDPLEKLFFQESDWDYSNINKQAIQKQTKNTVKILRQFYFESELKRMTTLVETQSEGKEEKKVVVKGAPEVIEDLLLEKDEEWLKSYRKCYQSYTQKGMRVLALASRPLGNDEIQDVRTVFEQRLVFQGFLITHSLLKWDTKTHLDMLRQAHFDIMMITGDNLLTAMAVGQQLQMGNNGYSILSLQQNTLLLTHNTGQQTHIADNQTPKQILMTIETTSKQLLGMDGECLHYLTTRLQGQTLAKLLKKVSVFGRTSPSQKEQIVSIIRTLGIGVLMCGDGTNDVGALKKADVGIALVALEGDDEDSFEKEQIRKALRKEKKKLTLLQQQQQAQRRMQSGQGTNMNDFLGEEYKFGDACIAAPFTSKQGSSIKCVAQVLKQGICTQVTTIQTYKILTLTSIISAYSFTMLHLQSLKFSESQSTITGILMTANYFYFSNNKPLKKISNVRPARTIFEPYFIISVLGQLAIHLYAIEKCFQIGIKYDNQEVNHDEEFKPTFLNTVAFFVNFVSQQCIFLFNHGGLPFNQPLTENKRYFKCLVYPLMAALFISQNVNDDINWFLQLHYEGIPSTALNQMFQLLFGVITCNYFLEQILKFLKYRKVYDYI